MVNAQQKALYTQYMFNGLAINPAYSAVDDAFAITALSRHQWVGFEGAPNTQTVSFHTPIKESNTSIGALLLRDQIGEVITEKGGYLTLAQRVAVGEKSYLAVGFNGGLSGYEANYSAKFSESPLSPSDPVFQDSRDMRANFGFGVMMFSDKYYLGVSSPHFYYRDISDLGQQVSKSAYRPHYLLQAGYLFNLGEDFKLKPNFLLKYVNGSPVQMDFNTNLLIKDSFWIGGSYRSADSFDAIAQIYISPNIQLGYSYDFTTTELAKVERGTHEILLQFRLPVKGRNFPKCYF